MKRDNSDFQIRQGDVLVITEPADLNQPVPRENGGVILAHGEVTGHAHQLREQDVELFENPTTRARHLRLVTTSYLRHEEHSPIEIPPGVHRVLRQTQWTDQDEPIAVQD